MKSYSWHGASPQVSCCPRDQKALPHFPHVWRVNPCFRNSSTSYSLSGIRGWMNTRDIKMYQGHQRRRSVPHANDWQSVLWDVSKDVLVDPDTEMAVRHP